jgi:Zn-finger nucleic acid-binding protein
MTTPPPRQCPKCKEALDPFTAAGVQVDICQGCGGVWLDRGELEKLYGTWGIVQIEGHVEQPRRVAPPSSEMIDLGCPACEGQLVALRVKGGALDGCTGCGGVWVDHGELGPALDSFGARGDPDLIRELANAVVARRKQSD